MESKEDENIDNILTSYYYTPLAKMVVQTEDTREGRYIKAINPIGIPVFVSLDDGGHIVTGSKDLTVVTRGNASLVPYSVKKGSYTSTVPYNKGVAIVCNRGICVLERGDTVSNVKESNYMYADAPIIDSMKGQTGPVTILEQHRDRVLSDNNMTSYPIVSLRDIRQNPSLTLNHTEIVSNRLSELSRIECMSDVQHFDNSFNALGIVKDKFARDYNALYAIVARSITTYRGYIKQYLLNPRQASYEKDNYRRIMYELKRLEGVRTEIVKSCRALATLSEKVNEITNTITTLDSYIITEVNNSGYSM